MSPHYSRAEILLAQSRPADAEREVRLALSAGPNDPLALALLARALVEQQRAREALEPARAAVAAAPGLAYTYHVLAHVHLSLDESKAALAASDSALALDPGDGDLIAQRASIHLARRDWRAALADAEDALCIQAENTFAANIRAVALRQLGRADEAARVGAGILSRAPEDAMSHCTQGWTLLHDGDAAGAQRHFREALRLDPEHEPARQGMLEALKARNPVYRVLLAYFLWMGRQSTSIQWAFMLMTLFGQRFARRLAEQNPALGVVIWPLLIGFYGFVYLCWTAAPMFNLVLLLDRFGRLTLSRAERRASAWFGLSLAPMVVTAVIWAAGGDSLPFLLTVVVSIGVAITVTREQKHSRWIMGGATAVLAAGGTLSLVSTHNGYLGLVLIVFLAMQFTAGLLR